MGRFSKEPPRRPLHLHHTYDAIDPELDRVLDVGPQGNDGSIVGSLTTGIPGIDGDGVRVREDADSYVNINDNIGTQTAITVYQWVNFERTVTSASKNVKWTLEVNSSDVQLTWQFPNDFSGWHFFVGTFNGQKMSLYHGTPDSPPERVAQKDAAGDLTNDFALEVELNISAVLDDTRVYLARHDDETINDVWSIAAEHTLVDKVGELWPNDGMPYIDGEGNARLGGTLADQDAVHLRDLDAMLEGRHISDAAGEQLDAIGAIAGIQRQTNEADAKYRARIQGNVIAGQSAGTFKNLLDATVTLIDANPEDVDIDRDDAAIAVAKITVLSNDLDNADISTTDFKNVMADAVLAGHDVEIVESATNAFTIIADGQTNDADKGLTSDSISTGGTLVSDA